MKDVKKESPWNMMFADDVVLCEQSIDRLEEKLEDWRKVLEERGVKISRTKSEYLALKDVQMRSCKIQDDELKSTRHGKSCVARVEGVGRAPCGRRQQLSPATATSPRLASPRKVESSAAPPVSRPPYVRGVAWRGAAWPRDSLWTALAAALAAACRLNQSPTLRRVCGTHLLRKRTLRPKS
ncbi:uncharacterized protein LOC124606512 [Schistocerca americana]|uniref:uncharacterized protein LOC124606512 n=1 Tax=Schistocerca americana TaxID=7009 RepID=UPI001F4FE4A4|nr:uncharacterized protein LOC124606512 [Schistocerca americana]